MYFFRDKKVPKNQGRNELRFPFFKSFRFKQVLNAEVSDTTGDDKNYKSQAQKSLTNFFMINLE